MRTLRPIVATLLASLTLSLLPAVSGARADPPGDARPWPGVLPDPGLDTGPEAVPEGRFFATRVLDARTLEPVEGARWIRTPEWIAPWRLHQDTPLDVATSDADGIAWMPVREEAWQDDCHWVVLAHGYAPSHEYGAVPEAETLLEPGVPLHGVILDPLGRPVAGALVELLGGCSHGTAGASVRTAADGTFRIDRVPSALGGQLWIAGPGIAADLLALDDPPSLGTRGVRIVMSPGVRYEGTLVDLLGRPIAGALVRAEQEQRGPAALTGADGRFALEGVEVDAGLDVFSPDALLDAAGDFHVCEAEPGFPLRWVVSPVGVERPDETARVRVRARLPDGTLCGGLAVRLVSVETGFVESGSTRDADAGASDAGEAVGEAVVEVAPGRILVRPEDPFAKETFDETAAVAAAGGETTVDLLLRPQPLLAVRGDVPEDATLDLAVPGAVSDSCGAQGEALSLPAEGSATLRVRIEGRPAFFFPVGPAHDGVREASVVLPAPHEILLPEGARDGALFDGPREAFAVATPRGFRTDASGPLTLRWKGGDGREHEARVDVPDAPGGPVQVDPSKVRDVVTAVRVGVRRPGEAVPEEAAWQTASPGDVVTFERPGWRRLRTVAPTSGVKVLQWGSAALRLRVRVDGKPADALVLVAGEVYDVPDGTLDLTGFEPGPLRIVAAPRDESHGGVERVVTLDEGQATECDLALEGE